MRGEPIPASDALAKAAELAQLLVSLEREQEVELRRGPNRYGIRLKLIWAASVVPLLLCGIPAHATISYVQSDGAFAQTSSTTSTQTDTLTHTSTAGDNIAVFVGWKTTTRTLTSITATGCHFFPKSAKWTNSTNVAGQWYMGSHCPAISSIAVTLSGGGVFTTDVEEYNPNILSFGLITHATGSSTACSGSLTTQESNNFVLMGCVALETTGGYNMAASVGNLRDSGRTGTGTSNIAGGACDNTAASPGSVTCTITTGNVQWLAVSFELRTVNPTDPLLVQTVAYSADAGDGQTLGNDPIFYLPQPTLSGNALICGMAFEKGHTITISDSTGGSNTWSTAATATGTNNVALIFYSLNMAASTQWFKVHLDAAPTNYAPHPKCKEAYHINALDVTATTAAAVAGPNVASGSLTPTQASDLIFEFAGSDQDASLVDLVDGVQQSAVIAAGSGFSLIDADDVFGECFQDFQQGAAAAINPSCDVENTVNANAVSAAFKTDSSGTPPPATGLHIDHQTTWIMFFGDESNRTIQVPADGNLLSFSSTNSNSETFTVADSHENTYAANGQQGNTVDFVYATNAAVDASQQVYVSISSSGGSEVVMRDIRGAKTSSPLCQAAVSGTGAQSNFTAGETESNVPTITPCAANDLMIWANQNGCGPPENLSSPSGAVTDNVWFTGQADGSRYDLGEGHGHYSTTGTASVNFNMVMQNAACSPSNGYTFAVWEISPAPSGGGTTIIPALPLMGAGVGN